MKSLIQEKWNEILELMKIEHDISEIAFNTWVKPLTVHDVKNNMVIVLVKDEQAHLIDYINKKYKEPLMVTISEYLNEPYEVSIMTLEMLKNYNKETSTNVSEDTYNPDDMSSLITAANLNPKYTFDTFVVGQNNNHAHATALVVADDPGNYANPLFIYGGVGLGKTHLMHSIAHYVISNNKDSKVIYVTSETFTNELIVAIRTQTTEKFKNKYRNIDMLLIDDIQFIVGRESTQEEFFHTFNTLSEAKKQIVISSDRAPKDLENLPDRLITRFKAGLSVHIQAPDYETRMAILNKRTELDHIPIQDEAAMSYIADNISSNIRELEGALKQVYNFSRLHNNAPITLELTKEALKDVISPDKNKPVTPDFIIEVVAEHYHITPSDITGKKKSRDIAFPRQICMYLCKELTDTALQGIGKILGDRDHSTIIHGIEKVKEDLKSDEALNNTIDVLIKKINPSS